MMKEGKVNGYICQGFNPVASFPNKNKVIGCLSKLKFLVTIDPLNTETSNFWQNHGELNEVDSSKIQTEVFRLPSTCFAEENGSIVNSGRWLQWHWKGADAPGIALTDGEILSGIFLRLRKMYAEQGGANPDQVLNRQPVRLSSRKANNLVRSPNCAMTVQPPVAAGFSPVAGRRKATRWHAVITPIRLASVTRWAGHGHGRLTAAFCITAPPQIRRVTRGIRSVSC